MSSINLLPQNAEFALGGKDKNRVPVFVAAGLAAFSVLFFAGLYFSNQSDLKKIETLDSEIKKADKEAKDRIEKNELLFLESEAGKINLLLSKHRRFTKLIDILQSNLDSEAHLDFLEISYNEDNEKLSSNLKCIVKNYYFAARQIAIFKSMPFVKKVNVAGISFNKSEKAEFGVSLEWQKDVIFRKDDEN